jgi:hypothetical protein
MKTRLKIIAMKTFTKSVLILGVFLISSCGDWNRYEMSTSITEEDFSTHSLTGVRVEFNDLIMNPNQLMIYDTLLITCNQSTSKLFHIFDLKTKKKIGESVLMGQGPMEMIQPYFIADCDTVTVYDMMTTVVSRYVPKEFISNPVPTPVQQVKLSERIFSKMAFLGDHIIGSPYHPKYPFYLFSKNGEKTGTFASYPISGLTYSDVEIVEAYRADIVTNRNDKVAFCYNFTDLIEIYDKNGTLKKRIHGPGKFFPHFKEFTDGVMITAKPVEEKYRAAFYSPVNIGDHFFVLYNGRNIRDKGFTMLAQQILVFDWDGNPIKRYLLDQGVSSITVDQKNKKIYGISNHPEYHIVEFSYI